MHESDQPIIPEFTNVKDMTQEEWNAILRLVSIARQEGVAEISYKSCRIRFHTAPKGQPSGFNPNAVPFPGIR